MARHHLMIQLTKTRRPFFDGLTRVNGSDDDDDCYVDKSKISRPVFFDSSNKGQTKKQNREIFILFPDQEKKRKDDVTFRSFNFVCGE